MERKRKKENRRSHMRNRLLCYLLSGALLAGSLVGFLPVSVSAAEVTESSNENQEILKPEIIVSDYRELKQAIDEAEDGDVIGISGVIEKLYNFYGNLGGYSKKVTLLRMTEDACIKVNGQDGTI